MAVGQIGLEPRYVQYELTLEELNLIYIGWFENIKRESENNRILCYNIFRGSSMVAQSMGSEMKDISITEFMPLPWENKEVITEKNDINKSSSREEFEAMKALINN